MLTYPSRRPCSEPGYPAEEGLAGLRILSPYSAKATTERRDRSTGGHCYPIHHPAPHRRGLMAGLQLEKLGAGTAFPVITSYQPFTGGVGGAHPPGLKSAGIGGVGRPPREKFSIFRTFVKNVLQFEIRTFVKNVLSPKGCFQFLKMFCHRQ
jgi:hypothetical protein